MMRQASFLPRLGFSHRPDHGGELRKGKRKVARPFSHKHAIHVVLRSERARGSWSLLARKNERLVERLLSVCARRYHLRLYRFVNVGNHLHLLIKAESRSYAVAKSEFQAFLRQFAGMIAFGVTGAKKGSAKGGFWHKLVYTTIVHWGRQYDRIKDYFTKNFFESKGLWAGKDDSWLSPWLKSMIEAGIGPPG
jgi:REP element-mobilizing transposase RayT